MGLKTRKVPCWSKRPGGRTYVSVDEDLIEILATLRPSLSAFCTFRFLRR